jgi:hypothetical protein
MIFVQFVCFTSVTFASSQLLSIRVHPYIELLITVNSRKELSELKFVAVAGYICLRFRFSILPNHLYTVLYLYIGRMQLIVSSSEYMQ